MEKRERFGQSSSPSALLMPPAPPLSSLHLFKRTTNHEKDVMTERYDEKMVARKMRKTEREGRRSRDDEAWFVAAGNEEGRMRTTQKAEQGPTANENSDKHDDEEWKAIQDMDNKI